MKNDNSILRQWHKPAAALLLLAAALLPNSLHAQAAINELSVAVDKPGAVIQPTMYGIFFEDINFGADGGLYAELIKNRSFEFENPFSGWVPFGNVTVQTKDPAFPRNPHYARLSYTGQITGTGLDNEGFRGIAIVKGEKYDLSFYARTSNNKGKSENDTVRVELINQGNNIFYTEKIGVNSAKWTKYTLSIAADGSCSKARLRLWLETPGTIDMDHVSLFPQKTFNNDPNGLRPDLAQALKDLHPGVFRFPGGCIVEGTTRATRYQWKNTVGPVENRPTNINRWNYTFPYKKFPDYYQSYGLGFYEYFRLAEEIGAEPLPVLNCGLSCQFENDPDTKENCAVKDLQPYIQDALDLIEFANGPVTSKWGKLRSDMGHPDPFHLKLLSVGNEQWSKLYIERLEPFVKAIRAKYPDIRIIGGAGPYSDGEEFDYLWPEMRRLQVNLVDEHFYKSPEWFLRNARRYDNYDRKGPKVFAGEYACHVEGQHNNFYSALCEAAFMTGFERNADVVNLCTYAPLFARIDAWQWRPDLIWFDNLRIAKTPNYYVQQLYGMNKGTRVLPLTANGQTLAGEEGIYATAALDEPTGDIIVKIANVNIQARRLSLTLDGLASGKHAGTLIRMNSTNLSLENTLDKPNEILPSTSEITTDGNKLGMTLPPLSFSVYRIKK